MGYIPPTTAAETSFIAGPAYVDFTQETASTAQLPMDSIDPNSSTGSQVLQTIYDGETLLGQLASMASASPGMSAWVAQEEQTISQQIAHEFGLLIAGSATPQFQPIPLLSDGQGTSSDSIQNMLDMLEKNHSPSQINTAMSSVIAAEEQAAPGDTQLQQAGSSLEATLSAYLADPSSENLYALSLAQTAYDNRLKTDEIDTKRFAGSGGEGAFEAAIDNILGIATTNN